MEDFNNYNEKLNKALIKKALGYASKEVVEEFSSEDGKLILNKRKVTKKNIPPDISAVKILLTMYSNSEDDFSKLSDEELLIERDKLLKILKEEDDGKNIE